MTFVLFSEEKFASDDFIIKSYLAYCRLVGKFAENLTVDRTEPKPFFRKSNGNRSDIYFSLSHSGKFIICAVSDENVGADIQEQRDADFLTLSKRLFDVEITDREEFYDRFTQGEARAKLDGNGLLNGMYYGGGENYDLFDGYSIAICGGSEPVFFAESINK